MRGPQTHRRLFVAAAISAVGVVALGQHALDSGLGATKINRPSTSFAVQKDPYRINRSTGTFEYDRASAFKDDAYNMYSRFEVARTLDNPTVAASGRTSAVVPTRPAHRASQAPGLSVPSYAVRSNGARTNPLGNATGRTRSPLTTGTTGSVTSPNTRSASPSQGVVPATTRTGAAGGSSRSSAPDLPAGSATLADLMAPAARVRAKTYSILDRHASRTSEGLYSIDR